MSTFPLFCLPLLVLEEVLKCLNPIELFKLSQCSKKMINLIPQAGTKNYHLFVNFSTDKLIINDRYYFGNGKFWSWISESCRMNIDGDLISSLRRMLEIFKCGIYSLETRWGTGAAEFESLIPIILENDRPIRMFTLKGTSISAENLEQIFKISESLEIHMDISSFRFEQFPCFPKHFSISRSYEITLSDLLSLKQCVSIELNDSLLTNKDLDAFLESWKKGEFPNLEFVRMQGKFSVKQQLAGLGGWPRNINDGYKHKTFNNCTVFMRGGETIERADGVKATVQLNTRFTFSVLSVDEATLPIKMQNLQI